MKARQLANALNEAAALLDKPEHTALVAILLEEAKRQELTAEVHEAGERREREIWGSVIREA